MDNQEKIRRLTKKGTLKIYAYQDDSGEVLMRASLHRPNPTKKKLTNMDLIGEAQSSEGLDVVLDTLYGLMVLLK